LKFEQLFTNGDIGMAKKNQQKSLKIAPNDDEIQRVEASRALAPFEEMDRMLDRMFEEFIPKRWMSHYAFEHPGWGELIRSLEGRFPRTDILDRGDDILVRAEVPGVAKEDLDITVTENSITIKGESTREEEAHEGDYYRCEINTGSFSRTISLPAAVEPDDAKATFEDGMLEIKLPKIEKTKRRSLEIE
jgi:HSP20 family protein